MDSLAKQQPLHFVLFPFMAQGHMIPMVDIARILARRGLTITIVTTPVNAARFQAVISRAIASGLSINIIELKFPCAESGLPEGCETYDMLTSFEETLNFFKAADLLEKQVEELFGKLQPHPSCIIADMCLPYTSKIASKFNVPKIVFHGMGSLCLLCMRILHTTYLLDKITASDSDYFVFPGLPDKLEFTYAQVPLKRTALTEELVGRLTAGDFASYGAIVNTFRELEPAYVDQYKKERSAKVWCVGPVSLCNNEGLDKAERGDKAQVDELKYMRWLDSQEPNSVLYACLGSLCRLTVAQLVELGLGLEASNKPFIWVLRDWVKSEGLKEWISETGFENRIKDRGVLIKGWAPQVQILSHLSIGGFLTHCGWNSTLEGITAGIPLLTWPLGADQFCNEKLAVQVLKVGVPVGAEQPLKWDEEEKIRVLMSEDIKLAIERVMDKGEEGTKRNKKAEELADLANRAVEEGGSSHTDITMLIQEILLLREAENNS